MKTRIILTFVVLMIVMPRLAVVSAERYGFQLINPGGLDFPKEGGTPDLIVKEIIFEQSASKIRVRIQNQGNGPSSSCYLALQSMAANIPALGTEQRVWTTQIPALAAGKGYSNVIDVSPLKQVNGPWRATVDSSNEVKESNENNNVLIHPVRNPVPPPQRRRVADLLSTAELKDKTK
jgi:hypothetical protein